MADVHLHEKRAERLKKLIQASQVLARVESLETLLPQLLTLAQDVTYTEGSSILLYDPAADRLRFTLARNECAGLAENLLGQNIELRLGEGIAGHVAQTREPVIVNDVSRDARFSRGTDAKTGFVTRNLMCAPIVHQDELLGVAQVLNAKERDAFDPPDLELLESFAGLAAVALIRSRLLDLRLAQERIQAQLDAAARIQASFWPAMPDLAPHAEVWARTEPAVMVGGDFYDCIPLADGSVVVAVGDVSGKGLPAALVGAALWARLRTLATTVDAPGEFLAELNRQMGAVLSGGMFATMLLGRVWPATGRVLLACAGHNAPLLCRRDACLELAVPGGLPVGLEEGTAYPSTELRLEPGDHLLFYTDGITEARAPSREFFGEERLFAILSEPARSREGASGSDKSLRGPRLVQTVKDWRAGASANDDVSVLEVHLK
ncbi:MAG: SpoIIE family protein phosphatase [Desulfovibrionaceae bacterium]|jgi:serine phosphatase RsbU (regulator of sigma subunit)|nr:SpoIIE family protein phosphatase [Desulfovibrionaceae bacterium]